MITKTYNVDRRTAYIKFFQLLNFIQVNDKMRLGEKQIEILTEFMLLPEEYKFTRFRERGKLKVMEYFSSKGEDITDANLVTTLRNLKLKKIIVEDVDRMKYLNPKIEGYLKMIDSNPSFEFVFKFNLNE